MTDERIVIEFESSGGIGGLVTRRTVDTATLPPGEADELGALLEQSNLMELQPVRPPFVVPDAISYRLAVVRGGQRHEVDLTDPEVPAELRPLLRYLATQPQGRDPHAADPGPGTPLS